MINETDKEIILEAITIIKDYKIKKGADNLMGYEWIYQFPNLIEELYDFIEEVESEQENSEND